MTKNFPCLPLGTARCMRLCLPFFIFLLSANVCLHAQRIYALTGNNQLVSFQANTPATFLSSQPVSGIASGMEISGLDFRPNTGELYALGYHAATGAARLYLLNLNTGAATAIGAGPANLKPGMGKIGFDFNPTVDRIRVTGSDNSNYRMHPVTGAVAAVDGNLAFTGADPNAAANPSIGAVAYTNSYIGTTSTTLYNYDDSLNILTTQIPPNNGSLNTVGASGITVNLTDPSADLDIYFDPASATNRAFLSANTGAEITDNLYEINLSTGAASPLGTIGAPIRDIAVFIDRTVPSTLSGQLVWALTANNNLISFDSGLPGTIRNLVAVSGLATGQQLAGLDIRPATGELYALGYNSNTGEAQLYTLNLMSGAASPVGTLIALKPGMGKITFDFNPTVDRIRLIGSDNSNFRLHPVTGAIAATDGSLAFAVGDVNAGKDPSIGTSAYTNSFNGATATTLYNYDDSLNILTSQIPPNSGTLNTIGSTGITANLTDPSTDMDIFYNPFNGVNTAYLTANTGMSASDILYTLNLATGSATAMGRIGNGIAVTDIAVTIQPVETACDTKTSGCIKYEVLSISQSASGDKTYRIRVTNTCAEKLFYTAFELPKSVVAETPGNSYSSPAGQTYEVRNPNFSPFYSIRFKPQGANGISGGQMDIFEYSLPAYASPRYIHAISRVGNSTYQEVYLNVFSCAVNSQDNSGANRDAAVEDAIQQTEARIFPNPATDRVTADLSGWEAPQVQVRLFNTQGQMALDFTAANAGQLSFPLPKQLPEGLYLLELSSEGGKKSVQKLRIQR